MSGGPEKYLAFCSLCHIVTNGSYSETEAQIMVIQHEQIRGHHKQGLIVPEESRNIVVERFKLYPETEENPFAVLPQNNKS